MFALKSTFYFWIIKTNVSKLSLYVLKWDLIIWIRQAYYCIILKIRDLNKPLTINIKF